MLKRIFMPVGALGLLSVLFFGRDAASYVGTSVGWMKSSVKQCMPIEFELRRARDMVKSLVPEIGRNMHVIASEEVELEKLGHQVAEANERQTTDKADLMRLKADLATDAKTFEYGGHDYTVEEVRQDLAGRFERYKTNDSTLKSLSEIQAARKKSLEAARNKLRGMQLAKRRLEVEVENLEARLRVLEVAQTTSDYNFDDSQLSRAKELITDIRTRLNVDEKLVNAETNFSDQIPVSGTPAKNVVEEVSAYFTPKTDKITVAKVETRK